MSSDTATAGEIETAGREIAARLSRSPLALDHLDYGVGAIQQAFHERRLAGGKCHVPGATCAALVAKHDTAFFPLISINDGCPRDELGLITDMSSIQSALDVTRRVLTEGR